MSLNLLEIDSSVLLPLISVGWSSLVITLSLQSQKIVYAIKFPILTQISCCESLVDFHESLNYWFSGGCRNWPEEARRHEIQYHFRCTSLSWFLSTGQCLFRPSWIHYCHSWMSKLNIKAAERFSFFWDLEFLTVKMNTRKVRYLLLVALRCHCDYVTHF